MNRRTFGVLSAGVAGALAADVATEGAQAAASSTGTIRDVRHVVVLMQENRSFDHYFGALRGVRGFGDRSGITLAGGYPVFNQPKGSGRQYPWQLSDTTGTDPETLAQCSGDLPHSWTSQHAAWNNGKLDSWVAGVGNVRTMGYLDRADIPFHYALADNYTICDAYFCSALSATGPNRTYLWSGKIDAGSKDGGDESGLTWQTYAEALQTAGVSWKVYQNAKDNYGDNALAYFSQFTGAKPGNPLYDKGMTSVRAVTGSTPDDIVAAIRADAVGKTLPQVSWIVPNQAFSEHPYAPPGDGAHFVHQVVNALAADQETFDSTVLFLNYDENDGFFDHVPPPVPPAGTAGEFLDGKPCGLGFRVPMLVISPWTRGGWVSSEVYDHTSVLRFLETWTKALGKKATCPNITAWRRKVVGDLTGAFDFANPRYGLPTLPATKVIGYDTCTGKPNPTPTDNALPAQESGTRPARALPYQPRADLDRIEYGSGGVAKVWVRMTNDGTAATHFAAYANAYRSGGPWQYTVDPRTSQDDFFNCGSGYGDGKYDLTVIGPNRFLRRFTGDTTKPGAKVAVDCLAGTSFSFAMTNSGTAPVVFTIKSTNYRTDGPWTYTVAAGQTTTDPFNVAARNGWYDFTVTVNSDPTWSQRFTGHVESGGPSVTG
ncbi:phosphocholine-specific phospholipase C [Actinokineospora sp. NBRC 105648]|uniref:phosphocholine-specific phospholipase C n=1 Tax=Actinokineospora sp. NBRC 105648 TaxID=3032206 RepID=UPI0025525972|nr:phospholipase C, phosphocholine-specific [Actinokineospora sp. NBRC 105648]